VSFEQFKTLYQSLYNSLNGSSAKLSNRFSDWISNSTIYNQLVKVWLYENLPHSYQIKPYENFVTAYRYITQKTGPIPEQVARIFYETISAEWNSVRGANSKKLKEFILRIIARVINKELGFTDEVFHQALFNTFKTLSQDKNELMNQTLFKDSVWEQLDGSHKSRGFDAIQEASKEYYNFAKRFILFDFPKRIDHQSLTALTGGLIKDRLFHWSDTSLNLIERNLDAVMKFIKVGYSGPKEVSTLVQKSERIFRKMFVLTFYPIQYVSEKALEYKDNSTYITADKYINLTRKLEETIYYTMWGYDILKTKALTPTYEFIRVNIDKTKSFAVVTFDNLNSRLVKKNFQRIHGNYEILKTAIVIIQNRLVKFIFDDKTLGEIGESIQNELLRLYKDLKGFEEEKVKAIGLEYYQWVLNGYKRAQKEAIEMKAEILDKCRSNKSIQKEIELMENFREDQDFQQLNEERVIQEDQLENQEGKRVEQAKEAEVISAEIFQQEIVEKVLENKEEGVEEKEIKALSEENREVSTENEENQQNSDGSHIEKEEQPKDLNDHENLDGKEVDNEEKISQEKSQDTSTKSSKKKKKKNS